MGRSGWPTGRWPPEEALLGWGASETESGPDGDSSGSNRPSAERQRSVADPRTDAPMARVGSGGHKRQGRRPTSAVPRTAYAPVVHCGSIRQAAAVLAMSEAPTMDDGDGARHLTCVAQLTLKRMMRTFVVYRR